jgi:hypothetical protein
VGKFRDWYAANPEMDDKPAKFKKPTGGQSLHGKM